ncbi:MAG: zf-HC2 domain-containing protein [Chloroflexi bacterium]|nr:zf-HC2 domain-containing protein [Chloroflexota bacterium]
MPLGLSILSIFGRRDWRDELSAYLDDELTPQERERVETRLAVSDEMQAYLADLQDMRSVLRSFAPAPSATPFQLTPEIVERGTRTELAASGAPRALRMSMATAAVGVAAFAAVMVFDVIDSPTVTFTTTQAGDSPNSVPTAQVVTDEVELESQSAEESDVAAVTQVSSGSEQPGRGDPPAAETEEMEAEEEAAVAAVEVEEQEEAMEQEAQQEEAEENWEAQQAQSTQSAADDPSRRALTAGRKVKDGGEDDAQDVTAAGVVAGDEAAAAEDGAEALQSNDAEETVSSLADAQAAEPDVAASVDDDRDVEGSMAERQSETEKRTVARSVRHTESDWPLEERPRSRSVELATDPSWERPVQIVLAAFAVAATVFWLTLAIVDRRRRT